LHETSLKKLLEIKYLISYNVNVILFKNTYNLNIILLFFILLL
jgi:hypothetical protein